MRSSKQAGWKEHANEANLTAWMRPCKIPVGASRKRVDLEHRSPHATAERGLKMRSFD